MTIEVKPNAIQKKVYTSTIKKLEKSQKLKEKLLPYLEEHHPHFLNNSVRKQRLRECCNQIAFRRYLESGDVQLVSSNFCKYDRICIACATKRAMRMIKKFSQGIQKHNLYSKKWYYIVLTISHKDGDKLSDLIDRLMLYKDKLARTYRNSKRDKQRQKSFFSQFDGMVISIEIAHSGKNGRHPHINILACSDNEIHIDEGKYQTYNGKLSRTNEQLKAERKLITNETSYIHYVGKIEVTKDYFTRSGIGEVFKYAIKFSDLTMEQLAQVMAMQHATKSRFFATYGIFRGRKLGEGRVYTGDWREGVLLYDERHHRYDLSSSVASVGVN